jgi:protein-disulfide isomerase
MSSDIRAGRRHAGGSQRLTKKNREAAERIRAMQAEQARAERRRRSVVVASLVIVLIAAVVGIGIAVQSNRNSAVTGRRALAPKGADADCHNRASHRPSCFGIYRGGSAPVTVTIYEDFQCPFCREFEQQLGPTLLSDINKGEIRVEYRMIAFLDDASTTKYSSRALETAACALDNGGPAVFAKLHDLLYLNQPAEGSAGLSDDQLADLAKQAGADKAAVSQCQAKGTYAKWVAQATDQSSKDGVNSTPTYLVNGKKVTFVQNQSPVTTLTDLIKAAQ